MITTDARNDRRRRVHRDRFELGDLFSRHPPAAIEDEMAALGSMILDPKVIPEVIEVIASADEFSRPKHATVYQALLDVWETREGECDIALLSRQLGDRDELEAVGGVDYLIELAECVPAAVNARHYARNVHDKFLVRSVIAACGDLLHDAYHDAASDVDQFLDRAQHAMTEIALRKSNVSRARTLNEDLIEVMNDIEAGLERGPRTVTGLPTGFHDLDELTTGLHEGEFIVIAARPSMGKSAIALDIVRNAAIAGHSVALFSLEMGRKEILHRLLCAQSGVDSQRVRRSLIGRDEFASLASAMGEITDLPIHIIDPGELSVLTLRAMARRLVVEQKIEMIVIDYLQLMKGGVTSSRESRQTEVAEISRGLKNIARELQVPIIGVAQLNRSVESRENKRPRMADLRESGAIEQDADVIMLLHREDYYRRDDDNYEPTKIAELIIAKQRNGPTDTVQLTWVAGCTRFVSRS